MSADDLRRIKQQQDAQAMRLQRMEMQMTQQNARTDDDEPYIPHEQFQQPPQQQQPQYQTVDQNQLILDRIVQQATHKATENAAANLQAHNNLKQSIDSRMARIVAKYPAIQEDDSALTVKARDEYARITRENPQLDEASKYELSVETAAAALGARPVNAPLDDVTISDFVMPAGHNPAKGNGRRAGGKSRLTTNIIKNAQAMGINVDPKTPEGKKNLAELDVYSDRFNADADESMYRYR